MNLETKITIYKFTPQVFTLTHKKHIGSIMPQLAFIDSCNTTQCSLSKDITVISAASFHHHQSEYNP